MSTAPAMTKEGFLGELNYEQMDKAMDAFRLADKLGELDRKMEQIKKELQTATADFNRIRTDAEAKDNTLKTRRLRLQHLVLLLDDGGSIPVMYMK